MTTLHQAFQERENRQVKGHPMFYRPLSDEMSYALKLHDRSVMRFAGFRSGGDTKSLYTEGGVHLCDGYNRIVFGDYGPYLEFSRRHLRAKLYCKFGSKPTRPVKYIWLYPEGDQDCKVYFQQQPVDYADYKVGMLYVSPYEVHE